MSAPEAGTCEACGREVAALTPFKLGDTVEHLCADCLSGAEQSYDEHGNVLPEVHQYIPED